MRFIWINPVVKQMYAPDCLDEFLQKHGYRQVFCRKDWVKTVWQEYGTLVEQSRSPVADVRCPAVERLLREEYGSCGIFVPRIEPILLHCAREISGRVELQGKEKIITTPCRILADMGNEQKLPDTRFVSWKQFLWELSDTLPGRRLGESPIPPGFFQPLGCRAVSLTGEDAIRNYLREDGSGDPRVIEMLFCKGGCHHGDGVIDLE